MKPRGIVLNGLVLAELRHRAGLSVKDAGAGVGISGPAWSYIESGQRGVTPERLTAIAELFGVLDERVLRADVLDEITVEADRSRERRNAKARVA